MRIFASLVLGWCLAVPAWAVPQQQREKKPHDRREYDLFNSVLKTTDAGERLIVLDQWTQEYPATDYREERTKFYLAAYYQSGQVAKAVDLARDMLRSSPDDLRTNMVLAAMAPFAGSSDPSLLQDAEAAARRLLDEMSRRPSANPARPPRTQENVPFAAHQCLGWVAMQRNDAGAAEGEFVQALQADPTAAQVSRWLGEVALSQNDPSKKTLGLFSLARAASYTGPNSLPTVERQEVLTQLEEAYRKRAGNSPQELSKLMGLASQSPLPPPNFRIP
jgi:tetratricopeptide (TPR) repeat protein